MSWVDHQGYFGPDRRKQRGGLRLRDRRHDNIAGRPPCLRTALRQLRMHVIEAHGPEGMNAFITRARGVAHLADKHGEREAALVLASMCTQLARAGNRDARQSIYDYLDRIYEKLRALD